MKVAAVVELHDRVAVAGEGGRVTLAGVIAPQVRPTGTTSVKATVPAPVEDTVIVEVREPTGPVGEVAAMVKSTKVNTAVVE